LVIVSGRSVAGSLGIRQMPHEVEMQAVMLTA